MESFWVSRQWSKLTWIQVFVTAQFLGATNLWRQWHCVFGLRNVRRRLLNLWTQHMQTRYNKSITRKFGRWTHNGSSIRPPSHIFRTWQFKGQSGGYQRRFSQNPSQPGCICHQISTKWLQEMKSWECSEQDHKPHWCSVQAIDCSTHQKQQSFFKEFRGNALESQLNWSSNPTQLQFGTNHTPHLWSTERHLKENCNINATLAQWGDSI